MNPTKEQIAAYIQAAKALGAAIKELGSVPSGHLYARVMDKMDLDCYNQLIDILKDAGVVRESGHVLTWVGK